MNTLYNPYKFVRKTKHLYSSYTYITVRETNCFLGGIKW